MRAYEIGRSDQDPVLVFVHGGPGSHSHFFARALLEMPALASAGFTWLLYDQRGCGLSPETETYSHEANIEDLQGVFAHAKRHFGSRLGGAVGHSYGAWLLYDTFAKEEAPPLDGPAVLLSLNPERTAARERNFLIELIEAKIKAPKVYQEFLGRQAAHVSEDSWRAKDQLRSMSYARDLRQYFYWANLEVAAWYERTKASLAVTEKDQIFVKVRDSIYAGAVSAFDLGRLPRGSCLVVGYQDFLMGGELTSEGADKIRYFRSGHYPHLEQPSDFVSLLRERVKVSS